MKTSFKIKSILFLVLLGLIIAIVVGTVFLMQDLERQKGRIRRLKMKRDYLMQSFVPLEFKVHSNRNGEIDFVFKILSIDNKLIARKEVNLKGEELFFDFIILKHKDYYLAFPYRIFTNRIPAAEGYPLVPLYDQESFPLIYDSSVLIEEERQLLTLYFLMIKALGEVPGKLNYGAAVHDIQALGRFIPGAVYQIELHTGGGLEVGVK